MWKKKSQETLPIEEYKFSERYYAKKYDIQEEWDKILYEISWWEKTVRISEFIEFLTRIEKVNQWEKKEEWKKIIDAWFNKYSNRDILYAFYRFVKSRENESSYKQSLDAVKYSDDIDIRIMWDKVSKRVFAYYWSYLSMLKRKSAEKKIEEWAETRRDDIINNLGNTPSWEIVLEKELWIREKEIKEKVKELEETDKIVNSLKEQIEEKKRLLHSRMKLKNVKKEIEEPLSKLKDLYQKRKSLLENIKKAIDKRTDYVKKLEIAIQVNNNLPRVETKTMEDIFNRLKLLESANISIDKYIKITEELFEDPQLTLF